jgi:short-subunit dehydrogenase involved in D-alanine esterification of teichoic acids
LPELAVNAYGTIDVVVPNAGVNEVEDIFEDKFDANG